jgi:IS5 family transposase
VVPWAKLCALIEPHYPKPGDGRKSWNKCCGFIFRSSGSIWPTRRWKKRCTTRRRCASSWELISEPEPVPDETTVCKFRHLLEEHNLGEKILGRVNLHLQAKGVRITTGTIVDATLIHAPSSTQKPRAEP